VGPSLIGEEARLLAAAARLGVPVPDGFVVTAAALEQVLARSEPERPGGNVQDTAPVVQPSAETAALPDTVREAIAAATREIQPDGPLLMVLRGDGGAGTSIIKPAVGADDVIAAYEHLVSRWRAASPPSTGRAGDQAVSVRPSLICLSDESSSERGRLFSSDPEHPLQARLVICKGEREVTHPLERYPEQGSSFAGVPDAYLPLIRMAVALERLAGRPQVISWRRGASGFAVEHTARVVFSDAVEHPGARIAEALSRREVLLRATGPPAVAGAAVGTIRHVRQVGDLRGVDDLFVAVIHSPAAAALDVAGARRAAALLVADSASAQRLVSLAWEAQTPLLAGSAAVLEELPAGQPVTVDAHEGVVYRGIVRELILYHLLEASTYPNEAEPRLLASVMRVLGGTAGHADGLQSQRNEPAGLQEVLQHAHAEALRSFRPAHYGSWGIRAGTPLIGSGWPGSLRVVDAGRGADWTDAGGWWPRLHTRQLRCTALRALLERLRYDPGPSATSGPVEVATLAILSEDTATLHVTWPGGSAVVDATLGDLPASNAVYCGLAVSGPAPSLDALQAVGFRPVWLGPVVTVWLWGRSFEETRRGLEVLGSKLARLVSSDDEVGSEHSSRTASQGG
jgi:phosphohistidine swiveling domain-containing protein